MAIIKCKMCGGDLNIVEGESVCECEYCGTRQTIPSADNEKKLTLFARANRLRLSSEFDKAFGIYESIVADFPEEAEAYWGLVLCKYGIEYVDDPATGKKIPTCHRSSFDSVMEDSDFEQACENADGTARRVYREEAKQIEEIRKGILEVSGKEEPYDIFICYKETDENGERTLDSVLAQDIYDALTDKGYRVFFARITLEDKLGQEYEPYIFAALNSAKIMLAVGTDYEYYNAVWVKNEWSRYLKLMAKDKDKHLIPCYKNLDAYDMPKEFAKLQAQDLGKVGAVQDLLRGIEKLLSSKEQKNFSLAKSDGPTADTLLVRSKMLIEDEDFENANSYLDRVLDYSPECPEAFFYKAYIAFKTHQENYKKLLRRAESYSEQILQEEVNWITEENALCCMRMYQSCATHTREEFILSRYPDIINQHYSTDDDEDTCLLSDAVVYSKDINKVLFLMNHGADVGEAQRLPANRHGSGYYSVLRDAILNYSGSERTEIVRVLLEHGGNPNEQIVEYVPSCTYPLLHLAIVTCDSELIDLLINFGASWDGVIEDSEHKSTVGKYNYIRGSSLSDEFIRFLVSRGWKKSMWW